MRSLGVAWLAPALALALGSLVGCAYDSRPSLGWHESQPNGVPVIDTDVPRWPDAGTMTGAVRPDAEITVVAGGNAGAAAAQGGAGSSAGSGNGGTIGAPMAGAPIDTGGTAAVSDAGTTSSGSGVTRRPATCPTGSYSAQFSCSVESAMIASTILIEFKLERRSLAASEATVNTQIAFDTFGGAMTAGFTARLDCASGMFHADIENGFAVVAPVPAAVPFIGAMEGQLDEAAGALGGTGWLGSPAGNAFGVCVGTWTAPIPQ